MSTSWASRDPNDEGGSEFGGLEGGAPSARLSAQARETRAFQTAARLSSRRPGACPVAPLGSEELSSLATSFSSSPALLWPYHSLAPPPGNGHIPLSGRLATGAAYGIGP